MESLKRKSVDLLVEQFWKQGYLTLKRRFGIYLPEPSKIGDFDVDIIARYKKNYAIGITLIEDDFNDPNLLNKINYLATRQTKFSSKRVLLFIGVPFSLYKKAKVIVDHLSSEVKKNIRLFQIIEKPIPVKRRFKDKEILFS